MRRIFLDLGAHIGESTEFFRRHHPETDQFEYMLFEPLPENIEILQKLDNVIIIPHAVSVRNAEEQFYTGISESGSLSQEKRTGGLDGVRSVMVHTIDFVSWFNELVKGIYVPEIWLKMNIEGAEYDIIDYLYQCGLLPFVHKFYINWHWNKIGLRKEIEAFLKGKTLRDLLFLRRKEKNW